jgi:hypothetical protein
VGSRAQKTQKFLIYFSLPFYFKSLFPSAKTSDISK